MSVVGKKMAAIVCALVGLTGAQTFANLIAYEGFNYNTPQAVFNNAPNGGTGWNGGWQAGFGTQSYLNEIRSGSVSYPTHFGTSGNNLTLSAQEGLDLFPGSGNINFASRRIGTLFGTDNTSVWVSFTLNGPNDSGAPLIFGVQRNGVATRFQVPVANGGTNGFVLLNVSFGAGNADTAKLYYNPTLATFDPNTATPSATVNGDLNFDQLVWQISVRNLTGGQDFNGSAIDEIRVGDLVTDVTPLPEPTTGILGGLAMILLSRRRVGAVE